MASYGLLTLGRWFWGMGFLKELGAGEGLIVGALAGWLVVEKRLVAIALAFRNLAKLPLVGEFTICRDFSFAVLAG